MRQMLYSQQNYLPIFFNKHIIILCNYFFDFLSNYCAATCVALIFS